MAQWKGFGFPTFVFPPVPPSMLVPPYSQTMAYDINGDPSFRNGFQAPSHPRWIPEVLYNAMNETAVLSFTYQIPLEFRAVDGSTRSFVAFGLNMDRLTETVINARASPATTVLLADFTTGAYIASSEVGFFGFDVATSSLYRMDAIPHPKLREMYRVATLRCPPHVCNEARFEHNGDIISSISIKTQSSIHFLMVQSTPRDHFFGEWDKSLIVGIIVSVLVCLLTLASCFLIWFLIRKNIQTLQESMELAAEMQNTEADALSSSRPSILSEIGAIQAAFESMNQRLLLARPFLPQSLLVARLGEDDTHEDDDGVGDDDGGDAAEKGGVISMEQSLQEGGGGAEKGGGGSSHNRSTRLARFEVASDTATMRSHRSLRGGGNFGLASGALATRASATSLISKNVAVLSINVRNFHEMIGKMLPDAIQRAHAQIAGVVESRVSAEKGVLDALHGDRFVVTFNVARVLSRPAQVAGSVALQIVEEADSMAGDVFFTAAAAGPAMGISGGGSMRLLSTAPATTAAPAASAHSLFSMGLAYGRALVGTMGTDTIKRLCTIGPVFPEAMALERVSHRVGTPVVVSDRVRHEIEHVAHCFYLGRARFKRAPMMGGGTQMGVMQPSSPSPNHLKVGGGGGVAVADCSSSGAESPSPSSLEASSRSVGGKRGGGGGATSNAKLQLSNSGIIVLNSPRTATTATNNNNKTTAATTTHLLCDFPSPVHALMTFGDSAAQNQKAQNNNQLHQNSLNGGGEEWLYAINAHADSNPFRDLDAFVRRLGAADEESGASVVATAADAAARLGLFSSCVPTTTTAAVVAGKEVANSLNYLPVFFEQPVPTTKQHAAAASNTTTTTTTTTTNNTNQHMNNTNNTSIAPLRSLEWARRRAEAVFAFGCPVTYDLSL